jgi:hypothetical protein
MRTGPRTVVTVFGRLPAYTACPPQPVILLIQHRLQHRRARGGQRRAHSLLQHAQPQAAAEHARGQAGEPAYLGGGDLLDPRREPLFPLPAGAAPARP